MLHTDLLNNSSMFSCDMEVILHHGWQLIKHPSTLPIAWSLFTTTVLPKRYTKYRAVVHRNNYRRSTFIVGNTGSGREQPVYFRTSSITWTTCIPRSTTPASFLCLYIIYCPLMTAGSEHAGGIGKNTDDNDHVVYWSTRPTENPLGKRNRLSRT